MKRIKNTSLIATLGVLCVSVLPQVAFAQVLATENIVISSGAGGSGGGAQTSCMIMSDGTSWSGGAVGVQGASSTKVGGGSPLAANVAFKYNVGAVVDSLNTTYGAGNWTIANPTLTFQYTLYANNNRFGGGAGTFDIYWVGNDNWSQGTLNPSYASSQSSLTAWSADNSKLASENYSWSTALYTGLASEATTGVWVTDKTGIRQGTLSLGLGLNSSFTSDILSASSSSDPNVSLYLMSTSDTMGMTIFTGGGQSLPTLSFDVIAVPEPTTIALFSMGFGAIGFLRRNKKNN
jgi:hypothetical protein